MVQDLSPRPEARPMAFVDDDQVEEIRMELLEEPAACIVGAPKGLIDSEVEIPCQVREVVLDLEARFIRAICKGSKGIVSLIAQNHAIGNEQNAGRTTG